MSRTKNPFLQLESYHRKEKIINAKQKQTETYNRSAHPLQPLPIDETVRVKTPRPRREANRTLSYEVQTETGPEEFERGACVI